MAERTTFFPNQLSERTRLNLFFKRRPKKIEGLFCSHKRPETNKNPNRMRCDEINITLAHGNIYVHLGESTMTNPMGTAGLVTPADSPDGVALMAKYNEILNIIMADKKVETAVETPERYSEYCSKGDACDACADEKTGENCLNVTRPPVETALSFYMDTVGTDPSDAVMTTYSVKEWKEQMLEGESAPEWIVEYINYNAIIRKQWDNDEIAIIHHDERYTLLENIGDTYPLWTDRVWEFFTGHPSPEMFTIIDLRSE